MLPKKFAVEVTMNSKDILGANRNSGYMYEPFKGYCHYGGDDKGYWSHDILPEYEKISLETFRREYLKENLTPKYRIYI